MLLAEQFIFASAMAQNLRVMGHGYEGDHMGIDQTAG